MMTADFNQARDAGDSEEGWHSYLLGAQHKRSRTEAQWTSVSMDLVHHKQVYCWLLQCSMFKMVAAEL